MCDPSRVFSATLISKLKSVLKTRGRCVLLFNTASCGSSTVKKWTFSKMVRYCQTPLFEKSFFEETEKSTFFWKKVWLANEKVHFLGSRVFLKVGRPSVSATFEKLEL